MVCSSCLESIRLVTVMNEFSTSSEAEEVKARKLSLFAVSKSDSENRESFTRAVTTSGSPPTTERILLTIVKDNKKLMEKEEEEKRKEQEQERKKKRKRKRNRKRGEERGKGSREAGMTYSFLEQIFLAMNSKLP
jgi:hypothetical protein